MEGVFPINDRLIEHVGYKRRRVGKVSICFGVSEISKIKLRMN